MFGNILKILFSTTTTHTKPTLTQQENHQNITTHTTTTTKKKSEIKERVKNQNHKQILLQKFQMRTTTRSVTGSRCDSPVRSARCDSPVQSARCDLRFVGSRCNLPVVRRSWVFWVRNLSLSVCACESFLSFSLSLFVHLRK